VKKLLMVGLGCVAAMAQDPVVPSVVEVPAADTTSVEAQVVDTPVAEVQIVDTSMVEIPAVDTTAAEVQVVDTSVAAVQIVDTSMVEVPAVDTTAVVEAPVVDTPTTEVQAVDSSAIEVLAADTSAAPVEEPVAFVFAPDVDTPEKVAVLRKSDRKRFFGGVFASLTYNDFYDTRLGLASLEGRNDGYVVRTTGAGDLMGNFWGLGYNAGVSMLFMPFERFGVHAEIGGAYRWARGESDVSVIVEWANDSQQSEKSDIGIDYYVRQVRIDVPVMARFAIPGVFYMEAGPMASFSVYSKSRVLMEDTYGHLEFRKHEVSDPFEFDVVAGIGTTKYVGHKAVDMGLRLVVGVTPLNGSEDSPKTLQGQFNLTLWFL